MIHSPAKISITGWDECPMYWLGDEFELKGNALLPPGEKPVCLILVHDISMVSIKSETMEQKVGLRFECAGCTGKVQARFIPSGLESDLPEEFSKVVEHLSRLPFFESLGHNRIRDVLTLLKLEKHYEGDTVIKKGDPGKNLYIIVSGRVEVLDDKDFTLAELGTGEIFGEMSLVSGDPVGATVRVLEPTTLLYMHADNFKKVLHRFPSLQMYISCLLARRLAHTNILWAEDLSRGMAGDLKEMSPSGLFQTMNLNQKTGTLTLELPKKRATLCFVNGEVVKVVFGGISGEEAFFALLAESSGRFHFSPDLTPEERTALPLGPFMTLLMEGLRRLDEGAFGHH